MKALLIKYVLPVFLVFVGLAIAQEQPPVGPGPQEPPVPPGQTDMTEVSQFDDRPDEFSPPPENLNEPPRQVRPAMPGDMKPQRGMIGQKFRHSIQQRENELIGWLEKNDPNRANALKQLKQTDQRAYIKRMMFEMKNYREIIDAEQTNPALAEVLKKDLVLKQKRNELLEKIKATADQAKRDDLISQLKDILGQRFDLIVEKKQIRYEELKKKLAELQESVDKSQAELKTIKSKKAEEVDKHLQQLLSRSEQIDWN